MAQGFLSTAPGEWRVRLNTGRELVAFRFGKSHPADPVVTHYWDAERATQAHHLAIALAAAHGPDKWDNPEPRVCRSLGCSYDLPEEERFTLAWRLAGTNAAVVYTPGTDTIVYRRHGARQTNRTIVALTIHPGRFGTVAIEGKPEPWELVGFAGALASAWNDAAPGARGTTAETVAEVGIAEELGAGLPPGVCQTPYRSR